MRKWLTIIVFASFFLTGCEDESHKLPDPVNDMIAYLNPDVRVLYMNPAYQEEIFEQLNVKTSMQKGHYIEVKGDNDSYFDIYFNIVTTSVPFYYSLKDDYLTVEDVVRIHVDEALRSAEKALYQASVIIVCEGDAGKAIDLAVEEAQRAIEEAAMEAGSLIGRINEDMAREGLDELRDQIRKKGEEVGAKLKNGDECAQEKHLFEFEKYIEEEIYDHFYDSTDFGLKLKAPWGSTMIFEKDPEPTDSTNLIHVFANNEGRFRVYKNAQCFSELNMVLMMDQCKRDINGFYYKLYDDTYSTCHKGDGFCTEKFSPTSEIHYYSDSTCSLVTRIEGINFKFVCR